MHLTVEPEVMTHSAVMDALAALFKTNVPLNPSPPTVMVRPEEFSARLASHVLLSLPLSFFYKSCEVAAEYKIYIVCRLPRMRTL